MLVPTYQTTLFPVPGGYSIHSFCSMFYDRSSAHFKVSFQQNAIYCSHFNFQYSVFPLGHPIAAYVFFLFFPSLISFSNMFYNAVPTQDVTNPVILPSVYCVWNIFSSLMLCYTSSFLTWSVQLIFSILLRHHHYKLLRYFWSTFRYHSFATWVPQLKIWHFLGYW